jgi:hypothetical protein
LIPATALVDFKSFVDDHEYDKEYESSQEELGAVKPIDVKNVYAFKPMAQPSLTQMTTLCMRGQAHSCFGRW